uniref:Nudix hydrolase domain-containing protein n=1 Tax=Timema bartmani TaxID=61472 RepID=A0A7R9F821_9NEOP|nr:unnamed protein product [Timema bartmani]
MNIESELELNCGPTRVEAREQDHVTCPLAPHTVGSEFNSAGDTVYYSSIPSCDQTTPIDTDKYPSKLGITIELCAGIVDKEIPLEEIASIEVLEECGYDVPASKLETITTFRQVLIGTG